MKRSLGMIVAIAAGLMVLVGVVGLLRDSSLFVATPEAVAEEFARHLVEGDFARAKHFLDPSMRHALDEDDLEHFAIFIRMRSGDVVDVRGERGWVRGARAEASAKLLTSVAGEWALSLSMVRHKGSWTIAEIGTIEREEGEGLFGTKIPTPIADHHVTEQTTEPHG